MSDEQRKDEAEVEGHATRPGLKDELAEDAETDFEAHVQKFPNVRMDSPSNS